ncbi:hypothetical protein AB6A40_008521 [Gnathostoma spinigerum]|uniref:Uncharacterized protein n=1 Tax=Gnathostoma spinigerum TaxID=75299 RepID=A0ABD6EYN3_9BILA
MYNVFCYGIAKIVEKSTGDFLFCLNQINTSEHFYLQFASLGAENLFTNMNREGAMGALTTFLDKYSKLISTYGCRNRTVVSLTECCISFSFLSWPCSFYERTRGWATEVV